MATKIQLRRDSYANWQAANPVLAQGEIGCVISGTDTGKFKIGDGVTLWNSLAYATDTSKFSGILSGANGGTGIANTGKTITISGNTSIGSSAHTVTLNTSANTALTLPSSGTLVANTHATVSGTALALGTNSSASITPTATASYTTTVPPAGTRVTVIILTSGVISYTLTFSTGFKSTGTLATGTVSGKYFTVSFISDGTNVIETGRTGAI